MTSLPKHHWMSDRFMDHEVAKFRAKFLSCTLLAVAAVISATVLLAWIFKPFGNLLPESWDLMKFNTALCVLLSCYALYIQSESTRKEHLTGLLLLGGTILALSGSSLVGHVLDETFIIETIIVDDADASKPGRMSLATSIFFLLTSYSILWFGVSERTSVSYLKSPVTYLSIVVLLTGSSYFFSATGIYAQDTQTITSVHTFVCMLALVVSLIVVDVRDGHHIALLGRGTGTRILLISFPFLFLIPFGSIALGECC